MYLFIDLLGLDKQELEWYQMVTRAAFVFIIAMIFIRFSGMRTFGTRSAFDMVVYITLGGMLSKSIMGHYPFFASLAASGALVLMHRLISFLSARSERIRKITAGDPILLFENTKIEKAVLKRYNITEKEIMTALHEQNLEDFDAVHSMRLEPDGKISVTKKTD
jgi:uncharacterized membrane protein YcaP (DUF421 family)